MRFYLLSIIVALSISWTPLTTHANTVNVDGKFQVMVNHSHGLQMITIDGQLLLKPKKMKRFIPLFADLDPKRETVVRFFDFIGGDIDSTQELMRILKEKICPTAPGGQAQAPCLLTTYVPNGMLCASSCVLAFMQGSQRVACEAGAFGFHASQTKWGLVTRLDPAESAIGILSSVGIAKEWLQSHSDMFRTASPTTLWPANLEGSNILTSVDSKCELEGP